MIPLRKNSCKSKQLYISKDIFQDVLNYQLLNQHPILASLNGNYVALLTVTAPCIVASKSGFLKTINARETGCREPNCLIPR